MAEDEFIEEDQGVSGYADNGMDDWDRDERSETEDEDEDGTFFFFSGRSRRRILELIFSVVQILNGKRGKRRRKNRRRNSKLLKQRGKLNYHKSLTVRTLI